MQIAPPRQRDCRLRDKRNLVRYGGAPASRLTRLMPTSLIEPALVPVEATTDFNLPHLTWHPRWRAALGAFLEAVPDMPAVDLVSWDRLRWHDRLHLLAYRLRHGGQNPFGEIGRTWNVPPRAIPDADLRREMLELARSWHLYEIPEPGAVILDDMLVHPDPDRWLHFLGFLRSAVAAINGTPYSAIASPTGDSGLVVPEGQSDLEFVLASSLADAETPPELGAEDDGVFAPHCDLWIPHLLANVIGRAVPGQGASSLLAIDEMWAVLSDVGLPGEAQGKLRDAIAESGACDYYHQFASLLYGDGQPWEHDVGSALFEASQIVWLGPGQGYLVDDRRWLHGRTGLDPRALPHHVRHNRLYRLAYNNVVTQKRARQRRLDLRGTDRLPVGCKASAAA